MKITEIQPYLLLDKLNEPFYFYQFEYQERKICIVKIVTMKDIIGWGEGYGPGLVVKVAIEQIIPHILSKNPLHHENIWKEIYRHIYDYARKGIFLSALSAIDIALWDIKGKILKQPVSTLLGGRKREKVKVYATGLYLTHSANMVEKLAEEAQMYKQQGYDAVKMKVGLGLEKDIQNVKAVRNALGDEVELMIDANHAYNVRDAKKLIENLHDQNIFWFEEPVLNGDYQGYAELNKWSKIPIAGGECEYLKHGAVEMLSKRCVDLFQPDTAACGGITEVKKIMSLAQAYYTNLTPHIWGTGIVIAANLHLMSNLDVVPGRLFPQEPLMEFDRSPNRLREELLVGNFTAEDGYLDVPNSYGLGIEVDKDKLNFFKVN